MKRLTLATILFYLSSLCFAYTGEIIKSFNIETDFPTGLTYDGKNLWLADRKTDKIYCINPVDGKTIKEISAPAYWPTGLTFDGTHLWGVDLKGGIPLSENYNGLAYKIDPNTGTILHSVSTPAKAPRGLAWDGKFLWCTDNFSDKIIQFDPKDGTTIKEIDAPAKDPRGLTFDGKYLWVADRMHDEIYMIDPETGFVIIITEAPGKFIQGLAFDGKFLWSADHQLKKLHKLKIKDDDRYRASNERTSFVKYTHQSTNFGPGNVKTLDVHIPVGIKRNNQEIIEATKYSVKPTDFVEDSWNQKTAHFHFENLKPGETKEVIATTKVKTHDVRYFVYPEKVGLLSDIPKEITDKYLADNDKYQITHPVIQGAVKKALNGEKNPYWMARKLYQYLFDKMYYEMVGGWNTAPTVLARGNGSCSEYSFVYISLCRAAGLPARYVGSVVVRGDDASYDDVFHRWAEVYLPNYGWVPIDASAGDKKLPRDQAHFFGWLSRNYYITTQSGGGSETMEWTYNSNQFFTTDPKTFIVTEHFADWEPAK